MVNSWSGKQIKFQLVIEIKEVSKSYGQLTVVDQVSLTIPEGEIMAIVGPSGAGKTSLLQIIGTLDRPDSGKVLFDGVDVLSLNDRKMSAFRNSNIGFVFQFHQLLPEFSALENVALPALIGGMSRKEAFRRATGLLDEMGLAPRLNHKPAQMSGGERQRTAIARAIMNSPRIVLADEPTGSLDSRNRDEIQAIMLSLRNDRKQTIVMVTHDPDMAAIADRTVTMADGKITFDTASAMAPQTEF